MKSPFRVDESSDSDAEEQPISFPINRKFRCSKPPQSSLKEDDLFVIDTTGTEDKEEDEEKADKVDKRPKNEKKFASGVAIDNNLTKILAKAVVQPGFEKNLGLTRELRSRSALKKQRKMEKEKTAGAGWFHMNAPELTEERRADLELIQMRAAIDPTAHFRKNDRKDGVLPKYFQVGRVVDAPEDYYSNRLTKKERKRNVLDEVMVDKATVEKSQQRFSAILASEKRKRRGAFQGYNRGKKSKKESF